MIRAIIAVCTELLSERFQIGEPWRPVLHITPKCDSYLCCKVYFNADSLTVIPNKYQDDPEYFVGVVEYSNPNMLEIFVSMVDRSSQNSDHNRSKWHTLEWKNLYEIDLVAPAL